MAGPSPESVRDREDSVRESVIEEITSKFHATLRSRNSELMRRPDVLADLTAQVSSVAADVVAAVCRREGPDTLDTEAFGLSRAIGANRALRGIHPTESLTATTTLFDTMLPVLVRELKPSDTDTMLLIAQTLHRTVMSRVSVASLSYVSFLMEKLHASREEERRRIARELHDRLLHGVALSLQAIDLHRHYASTDPERAEMKLDLAVDVLRDAVSTMQQLAAELRRSVGDQGMEAMLRAYLESTVDASVRWSFTTSGDVGALPPDVAEELYLILREAVRNALRHAEPRELRIHIAVDAETVFVSVSDDGCGFSVDERRTTGGLPSMHERALLLRGELDVVSTPGHGTLVQARVPLTGPAL